MTRGPIEGVHGHDDDEGTPGVKAWNRYLAHQDEVASEAAAKAAAEEAQRAQAAAHRAPPPAADPGKVGKTGKAGGLAGAMAAAAGAAAAGFKAALTQSPEQSRMDVLAAMQAEAIAHLEIAPHADAVITAQRMSDGTDLGERLAAHDLQESRRLDREERVDDAPVQKTPDARKPAAKYVAPVKKDQKPEPARKRKPGEPK